jgi:inosine-uridine nucleoside N-ribohydrolase
MDGGIDDALALILALSSPELEMVGITAVSGNVPVAQATINALRVVELLGRTDVWVAKGLANPLVGDAIRATGFHGKDGLGDSNLPLPKTNAHGEGALSLLSDEIDSSKPHELSLIATGPLTNIAALFADNKDAPEKIEDLTIMGGAFGVTEYGIGNETPVAEFNIYSDPEAAKIVFESKVRLKAVGLDVTMIPESQLLTGEYARLTNSKTNRAQFASRILANAMRRRKSFALHDPMAVATKVNPSLFEFEKLPVAVEAKGEHTRGMTVADRRNWLPNNQLRGQNKDICVKVDTVPFKKMILESLIRS